MVGPDRPDRPTVVLYVDEDDVSLAAVLSENCDCAPRPQDYLLLERKERGGEGRPRGWKNKKEVRGHGEKGRLRQHVLQPRDHLALRPSREIQEGLRHGIVPGPRLVPLHV